MTGRDWALLRLDATPLPLWPGRPHRRRLQPPTDLRDLALAEQITVGVIKNLILLQRNIEHHSGRRLADIDPLVQKILVIGLYQLRFLDRIPPSAAVDQAVEQAKRFGRARAAGMVNAVLRNALRQPPMPLPDPAHDPAGYAEAALSHPRGLFERMAKLLGAPAALELCRHNNATPPAIVRLMPGASEAMLAGPGISAVPHEQAGMWVVEGAKVADFARWAAAGVAQVQDPTAALVVTAAKVQPGQTVLDRCAGRGTKTVQLREAVGDGGFVVAIDAAAERCAALRRIVAQRKWSNVAVVHGSSTAELPTELPATFDRVLVDVPCSNSGVLARRPEARYAQHDPALATLAKLQRQILSDTAARTAAGGLLIYSTCSIWPAENQEPVQEFLAAHPQHELREEVPTLPRGINRASEYRDGGYFAVMARSGVLKEAEHAEATP